MNTKAARDITIMQTINPSFSRPERVLQQVFLLAIFFVPHSTVLTNVFVGLTYLAALVALVNDRTLLKGARFAPALLALTLFAMIVIGTSWSIAPPPEMKNAVFKYTKLFLIPIGMMLAYRDSTMARRSLMYFLLGASLLLIGSFLAVFDLMPRSSHNWWSVGTPDNPVVFKNHITFGILTVFSSLLCFAYHRYAPTARLRTGALTLGMLFAIPPLILTHGRTGYIVVFVGAVTLAFLRFRSNRKLLMVSLLAAAVAMASLFAASTTFRNRSEHLVTEIRDYANSDMEKSTGVNFAGTNDENSAGVRLNFYHAGLLMIAHHPIFGLGTGSFQEAFAPISKKLWPPEHPKHNARHQPHSEVIMIGVQLGLIGLALYVALLASLAVQASRKRSFEGDALLIMLAIFFVAAIFNSLIWDFTEGYWLTLMSGVLYGALRSVVPVQQAALNFPMGRSPELHT